MEKKEGQSEWDMRQAFLERINKAIINCYESIHQGNYYLWYKNLTILSLELSSHIRTDEEKELVETSMEKATAQLYNNQRSNNIAKFRTYMEAQKALHYIIRQRGFDIPITDRTPGSALRDMG